KISLQPQVAGELKAIASFRVFSKNHVLFRERAPIDRLYFIRQGFVRRSMGHDAEDFVGRGFWFGIDGIMKEGAWPYTATLMGRTEVLEVSIRRLRQSPQLREALERELARFGPPAFGALVSTTAGVRERELAAQQSLI